ncbi:hypothetical protein [uncultured Kordia sp.]|uniref:hypothetical protein n=1 Tax=uncultured Kordia sp. TaxID=507699 RepID=UPI0026279308|nr:hypothetical protein [uncultured Kordia sp.]
MNLNITSRTYGCYFMFLIMMLSASFKLFYYGPSVHFYVYPLPEVFLKSVPYIELLGGILYLIGTKKMIFRVYGGLVIIPTLIGAVASHIAFGWFNFMDGISEPFYFTLPSFTFLCVAIWVSYNPIKEFVKSKFKKSLAE